MGIAFFDATNRATQRITEVFEFVWPTAVGMWNLRWQVAGYIQVRPDADVWELHGRFAAGSGEIQRAPLRQACVDKSWEQQLEQFAALILINLFAIHESWCGEILTDLGHHSKGNVKSLQFPNGPGGKGVTQMLADLQAAKCATFEKAFYPSLKAESDFAITELSALMLCYRFFKELRNCFAHQGSIIDQKTVDAYSAFNTIASPTTLGVKEVPAHVAAILGKAVELRLRGVVGFGKILLKIMRTVDGELSICRPAEQVFRKRWQIARQRIPKHVSGFERIANKTLFHMHLPNIQAKGDLLDWIRKSGLK